MIKQQICRVILYSSRILGIDGLIPDKLYLQLLYRRIFNKKLNLDVPQTFNEKLQWMKLYDRHPIYTTMVDKYAVKDYVANIIGREYVIPTLGVWNRPEDIEWDKLPDQFVLKCTHDSGGLVICRDKSRFNKDVAIKNLRESLKRDYFKAGREWPYKNVPRRILAEKYIEATFEETNEYRIRNVNNDLVDYKFMCFNGKVKCCFTCTGRNSKEGLKVTFYDKDWRIMPFERDHPHEKVPIDKPYSFLQMKEAAEKLSKDLAFARIDFYEINKKPYFGEITLYPGGGIEAFQPERWDYTLGSWIDLPLNIVNKN